MTNLGAFLIRRGAVTSLEVRCRAPSAAAAISSLSLWRVLWYNGKKGPRRGRWEVLFMENYVDFAVQKAVELLAIDSPTGYTAEAEEFVLREFRALGFAAERTAKGGILIDLGGENADDALLLEAHADTLGGMVAEIKGDGRLRIVNVGGMNANNAE